MSLKTIPNKSRPDVIGPDELHLDDGRPLGLKRIWRVAVMDRSDSRKRRPKKRVLGIGAMSPQL